jgi:hypothetical protein
MCSDKEHMMSAADVSDASLDEVIFSIVTPRWQKVAMVIGKALDRCEQFGYQVSDDVLGARILHLAQSGRLESQGNLQIWRDSDVRTKPG